MASMTVVTQGPLTVEDYGLDAIAQHNAVTTTERFPPYEEDPKGLGIYNDSLFVEDNQSYLHNPPTPRSGTASDGIHTRSGRSTRPTDSPFSTTKSRVSKSPAARSRKEKKPSKLDRSKTPKLTAPLSILTKDMEVPMKDMDAWVHRSAETRQKEVEKRNGYVTRPMNSFMLYRSCYAERTKQWCLQNNHQVVSSVSGESWPMEPEEVREQFGQWAKTERANHAAAHPEYKFSPSKATNKRKKGDFSEDEEEASDLDDNPDGEYRGGSRNVRQRRHVERNPVQYLPSNVGFESHPYYGQQQQQYEFAYTSDPAARQLPSNVAYDGAGNPYNSQTGAYLNQTLHQQHSQYNYMQAAEIHNTIRTPTPSSMTGANQTLGGYGLPGGHITGDDLFGPTSRTGTPSMQAQYNQFGQQVYPQYQQYPAQPQYQVPSQQRQQQMFEHAQYLQQASQPQTAIDPSLEAALAAGAAAGGMGGAHEPSHFENAIGGEMGSMEEYFAEPTSPHTVLPSTW